MPNGIHTFILFGLECPRCSVLCDGTEIDSRQIITGISGKWIINFTEEDLIEYPLVYGRKGLFKRNVDNKVPKPYLIQAGCCLKVRKVPDFQFESVPSSIVADTEWYESLFYSIFGSKKIRWMLDVYNPEQ